ncbi:MAG: hypothetical protein ACK5P6_06820 [Pseudobdellovibrionaceae bacterium]|jgi:hypothetical protein
MNRLHQSLLSVIFLSFISCSPLPEALADSSGKFDFRGKAQSKSESRWTLQQWLEQKDRNRMMDLWLAMNAPSPYEFYVGGSHREREDSLGSETFSAAQIGAFATVLGLEADYQKKSGDDQNSISGNLALRIAGNAQQGTHLNLLYGLRTLKDEGANPKELKQSFWGAELNLYLNRHIGLSGKYLSYVKKNIPSLGELSETNTRGGLFIDFSFVRVFGHFYETQQKTDLNGSVSQNKRTGSEAGLLFFF